MLSLVVNGEYKGVCRAFYLEKQDQKENQQWRFLMVNTVIVIKQNALLYWQYRNEVIEIELKHEIRN